MVGLFDGWVVGVFSMDTESAIGSCKVSTWAVEARESKMRIGSKIFCFIVLFVGMGKTIVIPRRVGIRLHPY